MNKNTIQSLFATRYQCGGKCCLARNMKCNKEAINRNPNHNLHYVQALDPYMAYMQNRLTNSERYLANAKPGTNHSTNPTNPNGN